MQHKSMAPSKSMTTERATPSSDTSQWQKLCRAALQSRSAAQQDVERGAVELDTCNNVALHGPVNVLHDPAAALPFTQGAITAVNSTAHTWTVQARAPGRPLDCPSSRGRSEKEEIICM